MTTPTILLFDIDGTILDTRGAGRRAISLAFEALHGRADACDHFRFGGMTDVAIIRQGLEAIEAPSTSADIDRIVASYLENLAAQLTTTTSTRFEGVTECLDMARVHGAAVGLGTGNVKAGAFLKLAQVGLGAAHFSFGGFGDDHEVRSRLIQAGAERGAQSLKVPLQQARVIVIGDTPKDIEAAQAIGAECLAVTTGGFKEGDLRPFNPTAIVSSLRSAEAQSMLFPQNTYRSSAG